MKKALEGDDPLQGFAHRIRRVLAAVSYTHLIMIGVALDTMNKVESQLKMHNYEGFFK